MKKVFSMSILLLVLCSFVYSQQIFGMANPNIKQFIVQDKNGNLFSMNMKIEEVTEILGTPQKSENLWEKYPDASVGFYEVKYDGIDFYYYDNDNKIKRIDVYSSEYSILDNNITVGDSEKNIKNLYGTPWYERVFFDESLGRNQKQIRFSTIHTNLYFKAQTCDYYYCIGFNIDEETSKCNSFYILWNTDY